MKSWSLPRWCALGGGTLLLLDSLYLLAMNVSHLGMILPAVLGVALLGWAWKAPAGGIWRLAQWGLAVWLLSLLAFFGWLHSRAAVVDSAFQPRSIVVLGSSTPNATPSPTLTNRLELAKALAQTYRSALVVLSGGVDSTETVSEARVMADYLHAKGLSHERMVVEDKSTSTYENLVYSARLLEPMGITKSSPLLIVTSDFHTQRALWIAAKAGWKQVKSAGAPTPLYLRYNAWLREYFSWIKGWLTNEF